MFLQMTFLPVSLPIGIRLGVCLSV